MGIIDDVINAEKEAKSHVENQKALFEKKLVSEKELISSRAEIKIEKKLAASKEKLDGLNLELDKKFAAEDKKLAKKLTSYDSISKKQIDTVAKKIVKTIESEQ